MDVVVWISLQEHFDLIGAFHLKHYLGRTSLSSSYPSYTIKSNRDICTSSPGTLSTADAPNNAVNSPLLRLPGELRNLIWDFVFHDLIVDIASTPPAYDPQFFQETFIRTVRERTDTFTALPNTLKLPLVCRQLHNETFNLLFKACTFIFATDRSLTTFVNNAKTGQVTTINRVMPPQEWYKELCYCTPKARLVDLLKKLTTIDVEREWGFEYDAWSV